MAIFGIVSITAGIAVALLQPRTAAARAFLLFGVVTGLFGLTGSALYRPSGWPVLDLHLVMQAVFPATFLHLGLVFPVIRRMVERRPAWLALPYAISALLAVWMVLDFGRAQPGLLGVHLTFSTARRASWVSSGSSRTPTRRTARPRSARSSTPSFRGSPSEPRRPVRIPRQRPRTRALPAQPGGPDAPDHLPVGGLRDRPPRPLRHRHPAEALLRLCPADAGDHRRLCRLGRARHLPPTGVDARRSPAFTVAFVVLTALVFQPVRNVLQRAVDRLFWRGRLDYRRTVSRLSAALTSLLDLDEIPRSRRPHRH